MVRRSIWQGVDPLYAGNLALALIHTDAQIWTSLVMAADIHAALQEGCVGHKSHGPARRHALLPFISVRSKYLHSALTILASTRKAVTLLKLLPSHHMHFYDSM
jgi:hypothetical protein